MRKCYPIEQFSTLLSHLIQLYLVKHHLPFLCSLHPPQCYFFLIQCIYILHGTDKLVFFYTLFQLKSNNFIEFLIYFSFFCKTSQNTKDFSLTIKLTKSPLVCFLGHPWGELLRKSLNCCHSSYPNRLFT